MLQKKIYEEKMNHRSADLPIALHQLEFLEGTDTVFYLHWHKEFEFLVVTKGVIEFTIEDRTYLLNQGDCVFVNSNLYHSAKSINKNGCGFFAIDFSYEFIYEDLHTSFSRKYIQPVLDGKLVFSELIRFSSAPSVSWQIQVLHLLHEINKCGEKDLASYELMIKCRILNIWELFYDHAIIKNIEDEKYSIQKNLLKPVIKYIKNNFSHEITLSTLSNIIPMSEGQFCRVFKKVMKVTPFQFLMRYRILQSCNLLIETDKKIGEIANLSGFNNISYYNKVFLTVIGCSPKQYRESYFKPNTTLPTHPLDASPIGDFLRATTIVPATYNSSI